MRKRNINLIGNALVVILCIMGAISMLMEFLEIEDEQFGGTLLVAEIVMFGICSVYFLRFRKEMQ